jgi:hypothetical protein
LTDDITANLSLLQNLKFCGPPVKKYVVLVEKWKYNFKTPSYIYGNKIFMSIYEKQYLVCF